MASAEYSPVIYVIEFDDMRIKVGRTVKCSQVLKRYQGVAKPWGRLVTRHWTSSEHANYEENERTLKRWLRSTAMPHTGKDGGAPGEWFSGISFDDVVQYAESLPKEPFSLEVFHRDNEQRMQGFISFLARLPK